MRYNVIFYTFFNFVESIYLRLETYVHKKSLYILIIILITSIISITS